MPMLRASDPVCGAGASEIASEIANELSTPCSVAERYGELLGRSAAMRAVFEMLRRIEAVNVPTVLLVGESGTGKELVANAIHTNGPRRSAPYVEVDCAAVPDTLLESELFGHEKGSFTDARQLKRGLFEVAANGTLFLDEIGEMGLAAQAKLLRALETRRFKRVGGVTSLPLDAGIVAASNRDLRGEVKEGRFRADLFFRLNVVPISIPPLRARRDDIDVIAAHLVQKLGDTLGRRVDGISPGARALLHAYAWPGNVRELRNVLERAIILKRSDGAIDAADLSPELSMREAGSAPASVKAQFPLPPEGVNLVDVERALVEQALERAHGVRTHAAKLLGISRFALRYRLEKFGLLAASELDTDADPDVTVRATRATT
jgi:two-component system response regulator AtoC